MTGMFFHIDSFCCLAKENIGLPGDEWLVCSTSFILLGPVGNVSALVNYLSLYVVQIDSVSFVDTCVFFWYTAFFFFLGLLSSPGGALVNYLRCPSMVFSGHLLCIHYVC